jgi:hypothetical protein
MSYKPSKRELKKIENLNKGYNLIKEGLDLIKDNLPKRDRDVEMESFKMNKHFDNIIKRIHKVTERNYIDQQFIDIINTKKTTKKSSTSRLNKRNLDGKKKKKVIKKPKGNK